MKKLSILIGVCCALPIIIVGLALLFKNENKSTSVNPRAENKISSVGVEKDYLAADFSFQTIDGQSVSLSSLKGQPVLFAFVLTVGCVPCALEAQEVREAQKEIPFKVIQLAVDSNETIDDLKRFRINYGNLDWLIGYDQETRIAKLYNVRAIDTTIIVDATGKIVYRDNGYPLEKETVINVLKSQ